MFEKIMSLARPRSIRIADEDPAGGDDGAVAAEDMRDVATESALAAAVDASPAVLIALWTQDQRLHPEQRGPRRRA